MSEEIKKTVEDTLDDLFGESKSSIEQIVELPSRGIGYPPGMDKVTIRTLTFEDEKIMSESNPDQDIISLLLTRCVSNLDPDILYGPDKLYLLYKIRELSYGTNIKLKETCPNCNEENQLEVDLSQLPVTKASDEFSDTKEITLPDLGKVMKIRVPRASDSGYMVNKPRILDNLWRFVINLDKYTDPKVISQAIKRLTSRDTRSLIEALFVEEFGIEAEAKYICSRCRQENIIEVPLSEAFFTVS
jgi:hypothetical protein